MDDELIPMLKKQGVEMRVGRRLGRTLYFHLPGTSDPLDDIFVGVVDRSEVAAEICRRWNEGK